MDWWIQFLYNVNITLSARKSVTNDFLSKDYMRIQQKPVKGLLFTWVRSEFGHIHGPVPNALT